MHKQRRQYDPVAASAIAALNSTQRAGRSVRNQVNAPQPPGAEMAFNQGRSVLQQVSSLSPLNVFGTGQTPELPGMSGQGGPLPGLPSPNQMMGSNFPAPSPPSSTPNRAKMGKGGGSGAGEGGKNSGSTDEQTGSGSRSQSESRT